MDSHKCNRCGFTYSSLVMTLTVDMGWYCDECLETLVEEGELGEVTIPLTKEETS